MCSYHSHFYTCLAHYYTTTVPATLATPTATDFTTTPPPLQCVYIYKYFIPVPRLYLLSFCRIISGHSLMVNLSRILKSLAVEHSVAVVVSMTVCQISFVLKMKKTSYVSPYLKLLFLRFVRLGGEPNYSVTRKHIFLECCNLFHQERTPSMKYFIIHSPWGLSGISARVQYERLTDRRAFNPTVLMGQQQI